MTPNIKQSDAAPLPHSSTKATPIQYPDYYTLKSGQLIGLSWDSQLALQKIFENAMFKWLGKNWREKVLGG